MGFSAEVVARHILYHCEGAIEVSQVTDVRGTVLVT